MGTIVYKVAIHSSVIEQVGLPGGRPGKTATGAIGPVIGLVQMGAICLPSVNVSECALDCLRLPNYQLLQKRLGLDRRGQWSLRLGLEAQLDLFKGDHCW